MDFQQFMLALFTVLSIGFTQCKPGSPLLKWACIVGLLSQPFWFWSSIEAGQSGVLLTNIVMTLIWLKGLWIHWISPRRTKKTPLRTIVLVKGIKS